MSVATEPKPAPKMRPGTFKCFQCRKTYASRDGGWFHWSSMEVHLCNGCERTTRVAPERKRA